MSPTRWVAPRASSLSCLWSCLALACFASTASAQFFDPTLRFLDLGTGEVARSPRLLGMGGLSLVVPDRNTGYSLWDLGGLPVGLYADDTTSTLDIRPVTDALSSVSRLDFGRERQDLASRRTASQLEAVYRSRETGSVFGLVGDLSSLRWDHPYAPTIGGRTTILPLELRQSLVHPEATAILGGELPRFFDHHVRWGAHLRFRDETVEDQYRLIVENAAGEYIDVAGGEVPAPGEFAPTSVNVNSTGYGVSTSYAIGKRTQFGLGIERENDRIHSTNDLQRSSAEYNEVRPYWNGQAALVGGFGKTFEYGVTGIGRLAKSEADWRFTASAGVGADPLTGRGNLFDRDERSSELTARARWTPGRATFAGSLHTEASKVLIDPPQANDPTSLNRFINLSFNRPGADSLTLPDSIVHGETRRYAWSWGAGAGYRFRRTTVGGEFHWSRDVRFTEQQGEGPKRIAWDLRGGLEHPLGAQLTGRIGYAYRWVDEDDYAALNEFKANAASVGLGFSPAGATWKLESAYRLEFRSQDFSSSADQHQSRQNAALELHWRF